MKMNNKRGPLTSTDSNVSADTKVSLSLWSAVLMQAAADYHDREFRMAALHWFAEDRDDLGSFQWVCTLLGRDPAKMRSEITNLSDPIKLKILKEKFGVSRSYQATRRSGRGKQRRRVHEGDGTVQPELQVLPANSWPFGGRPDQEEG